MCAQLLRFGDKTAWTRAATLTSPHQRAMQVKFAGRCVDIEYISKEDGAGVHLWDCGPGENQLFGFTVFGDGHRIIAKHSNKVGQHTAGAVSTALCTAPCTMCSRCTASPPVQLGLSFTLVPRISEQDMI